MVSWGFSCLKKYFTNLRSRTLANFELVHDLLFDGQSSPTLLYCTYFFICYCFPRHCLPLLNAVMLNSRLLSVTRYPERSQGGLAFYDPPLCRSVSATVCRSFSNPRQPSESPCVVSGVLSRPSTLKRDGAKKRTFFLPC